MQIERGSTWNIWDFHVHTPYSCLNNGFGFDPTLSGNDEKFDEYVKFLFTKAVDKGVVAIGVTDYFFIDGYKRIRQEYLSKPDKMKVLFPDYSLREKVMRIFVFPNIEFRLNTFIGEKMHPVNYHVFLSDKIRITDIEEIFIRELKIRHEPNASLPLTPSNVKKIGQEYKICNPNEHRNDFIVGLEKITIDDKQVLDILCRHSIFQNQYLISIPVDEDLSKISWSGRNAHIRKIFYKQCNMLMSSNEGTRKWALGSGSHEQEQLKEFGGLKPCIWGSDAHSYDKIFSPDDKRFCWIKAEPTFEGLRQILHEPAERVRIQQTKPEQKNEHQIIDHVIFRSPEFTSTPIYLSEGLTAIIGGKSTGKSIFLRNISRNLDQCLVDDRESQASPKREKLTIDVEVYWKDGVSDKRKIIYVPQSWLNHVVDDTSGNSQLNAMIQSLLLQQEEISKAHSRLESKISEIRNATRKNIIDYVEACEKIQACEKKLHETGGSKAYRATIKKLEESRIEFSAEAGITDDQVKRYAELEKTITEKKNKLEKIKKEKEKLSMVSKPFVMIPKFTTLEGNDTPRYDFEGMNVSREQLERFVRQMNIQLYETWLSEISKLQEVLLQKEKIVRDECVPLYEECQKLKNLISHNDQLKNIESRLTEEKIKLDAVIDVEEMKKDNEDKAKTLKEQILNSRQMMKKTYEDFIALFLSVTIPSDTNLKFDAELIESGEEFCNTVENLFNKRNLQSFKDKYHYNFNDSNFAINCELFNNLLDAITKGTLGFKGGNTFQSALEQLFSDRFHVHYIIKSGNDTINSMSPGKKALVLLEIIVNLDNSNCPLLIDQPEDDLDNRSIYNELVQYLRKKKHERQIIVVTHNANVVIGTDAEEVIIANQEGDGTPNYSKRFEYRCGAIENISPRYDDSGKILPGILNQKGIQEQICDILEGGKEAFNMRRKKYLSVNQ